jgi:hypothetical protein
MTAGSAEAGLEQLDALVEPLRTDAPIGEVERHEETLKRVLGAVFERGATADEGRRIAAFQRDVGLIMKYKPYAVKASTPLGFSLFLQEPRQGFSFQKHSVRKVEAFHILEVDADSYVFLAPWSEWQRVYEPVRFQRWLDGATDEAYERFRLRPSVGDIYLITDRETVHTVIGCRIEEYASVSVDVVERLHDQNRGAPLPAKFTRENTLRELAAVHQPGNHRSVHPDGRIAPASLEEPLPGVRRSTLVDCPELQATVWKLAPGTTTPILDVDRDRAVQLYVSSGSSRVAVGARREIADGRIAGIGVECPGTAMIAPGLSFTISNASNRPLVVSMHAVRWRPAIRTLDA